MIFPGGDVRKFGWMLGVVATVALFASSPALCQEPVQGERRQRDLVIALVQILGYDIDDPDDALDVLLLARVEPTGGWKPQEFVTVPVACEVDDSLHRSQAAGLLKMRQVEGAVVAGMAALGLEYSPDDCVAEKVNIIPYYATVTGPPNDPVYREGSPFKIDNP
jgi:hypothetical protein